MKNNVWLIIAFSFFLTTQIGAKRSYSYKMSSKKSYTPKAMCSGFGKPSKSTGRIKTKVSKGYIKRGTGKWVNSYARS